MYISIFIMWVYNNLIGKKLIVTKRCGLSDYAILIYMYIRESKGQTDRQCRNCGNISIYKYIYIREKEGWLVKFYRIPTFVSYLTPNPFLYKYSLLFQKILFSISTQFRSIWLIDKTLLDATTPIKSGPGSNGNEGVLRIAQSPSITRASPSDSLVSYPGPRQGDS